MKHYSEADLLETYYMQPGQSMPVMMHLADCDDCAAKYERLERKLRGMSSCEQERPETFWARQRISVMRKIDARRAGALSAGRIGRVAAAALLVLAMGGVVTWRQNLESGSPPAPATAVATVATASLPAATQVLQETTAPDPWQSDELKDFQSMVAWESWVDDGTRTGDKTL